MLPGNLEALPTSEQAGAVRLATTFHPGFHTSVLRFSSGGDRRFGRGENRCRAFLLVEKTGETEQIVHPGIG